METWKNLDKTKQTKATTCGFFYCKKIDKSNIGDKILSKEGKHENRIIEG